MKEIFFNTMYLAGTAFFGMIAVAFISMIIEEIIDLLKRK